MIWRARATCRGAGHYSTIADALAAAVAATAVRPRLLVEVGAGTGYYLSASLGAAPEARGIAIDASVPAARRAARVPRVGSVVADAWSRLPVLDGAADLVLSVFAPRNPVEIARILAPGGSLLVVTPQPGHLAALIGPLDMLTVGDDKDARLNTSLGPYFELVDSRAIRFTKMLNRSDVRLLVEMGPSAHHVDRQQFSTALAALPDPCRVTADVTVTSWSPISRQP